MKRQAKWTKQTRRFFRLRLPFLKELKSYSWDKGKRDMIAGVTLTFVSIPQAIGFSLILGVEPMPVLVSMIVGGFVGSLFFASRYHVFGPTSSISLIVAAAAVAVAPEGMGTLSFAIILGTMIGIIQLTAGLFRFGEVTKYISRTVVVAYSTGIGVLLVASQMHNIIGVSSRPGEGFWISVLGVLKGLGQGAFSWWAIGIGVATLIIFEVVHRFKRHWPEALIGLVVMGVFGWIYALASGGSVPFAMIRDEGVLQTMVPSFAGLHWNAETWGLAPGILGTAVAVAILGMLEASAIVRNLGALSGQKVEPNQELVGMGVANLSCAMFGGVPGSSSFARSAVNYQSGAATQLASMFSSLVVLFMLLFIVPVFNYIPVAALAMHLIRVGVRMINWHQVHLVTGATKSDATVFFCTLLACLCLNLDTAIYVGTGLALALFLKKSSKLGLVEYGFDEEGHLAELASSEDRNNAHVSIIHIEGELFFGATDMFQEEVRRQSQDDQIRVFILRMKNARHLDASAIMALESVLAFLRREGKHLLISGLSRGTMRVLKHSGFLATIGEENVFISESNQTMSTKRALMRAVELLKDDGMTGEPQLRLFYGKRKGEEVTGKA